MPDSTEERERDAAIREMVLALALKLCASVVERAEAAGLQQAHLVEDVDEAGATWKMRAIYYREPMTCHLQATVEAGDDHAKTLDIGDGVTFISAEELIRLFGGGPQAPALQLVVPVSWVKLAAAHGA